MVEGLEGEVDAIDETIFLVEEGERQDVLRKIASLRRKISQYIRALKPKRSVWRMMCNGT